jgi:hypothetical protein
VQIRPLIESGAEFTDIPHTAIKFHSGELLIQLVKKTRFTRNHYISSSHICMTNLFEAEMPILSTAENKSNHYYVWRSTDCTAKYPTQLNQFDNIDKREKRKFTRSHKNYSDILHLTDYSLSDIVYIFEFDWKKLMALKNFETEAFFKVWGAEIDDDIKVYLDAPDEVFLQL